MADRDEILLFANEYLGVDEWSDYCPNGLQVSGRREVRRVASAVSCSRALFEQVARSGADMLITHHGMFWRDTPQIIAGSQRERLKLLLDNDITLAGYHLPLDAHPEVGNNALIAGGLGLVTTDTPFALISGKPVGVVGEYSQPVAYADFSLRLKNLVQREPLSLGPKPDDITSVAICSGGGQREIAHAIELGVDAFVTGEAGEPTMALAEEGGVAFFAAGHYATEVFGIRRLGELIAERFGVEHEFHHLPNPV